MVSFTSLLAGLAAIVAVTAAPATSTGELQSRELLTKSKTGDSGGFYYSFWTDNTGTVSFDTLDKGSYSVNWSGNRGNFVGGKGWRTGTTR